ncbi:non-ribosomal peptide synthetase [Chamaesiphon polymorphus CCALA 037]|uniref:Non-ribosomal peptide synthetase n=2 Tax=Chamaesiphon TaxID=217161 RepID=A0A2T1G539_9CYAN|nr:non-ribosomal peptide synthetase [Chamaesiphon polymorphus CCALA 037]
MAGHFENLLSAIGSNPHQLVSEISLLSAAERQQLLVEWNQTASQYPDDKCIHHLFEAQVEKTPDAIAVVFEDEQLTYQQLNQRANQLAHHLQSLGVKPEVLVGICVERSLAMVVGLLGILKAGGAYVPLDPSYPPERLSYMLADAGVEVLLTQQDLLASLPAHSARLVCLDTDWDSIARASATNLSSDVAAANLAYVIYTSGSTGLPKGVQIEHQAIVWHCHNIQSVYRLESSDRVLQFASIGFDPSVEQIFVPLAVGASIVVRGQLWQPFQFHEYVEKYQISVVDLPPAYWQQLILEWVNNPQSLRDCSIRLTIVGGDVMPSETVKLWQQTALASSRLLNAFGLTEATITSTIFDVSCLGSSEQQLESISIGKPIANTQIYILDRYLQPVPIGVPGELHIGGDSLARGYLNRPDLTAAKFISDPFSDDESARLYKTGDLARYLPDGNIEFLGRIDNQVKIRGFRIELGEVEAVLSSHPQVQQAVVIDMEDRVGKRLVAYVVTEDDIPDTLQLREYVKQRLPEYMVPAAIVTLDSIPLTPNGKVDRKALPIPDGEISRTNEYVAPRTPNEEIIANIFASILGIERVGIHDNFFELGGHSLLATQLISRLRASFALEIPLRIIFELPTVSQLAHTLSELKATDIGLSLPSIVPIADDTLPIPLSFAQQRLWFLDRLAGGSHTYNMPLALRLSGVLDTGALQHCLSQLVERHEALRTHFATIDGSAVQIVTPHLEIPMQEIDLQSLNESTQSTQVQRLAIQEAQQPFDLATGPMLRVKLLKLAATENVLIFNMHHIISDGWSMGILVREVTSLYQAYITNTPVTLPELPIQYPDFAHWQRQWLTGDVLQAQVDYWKAHLAGAPPLLELPTDHPRPAIQSFQGSQLNFNISVELTEQLEQLSRQQGVTLFMTLLGAYAVLLSRYSGDRDIVIGSPIANRNRGETENLIGFFVNTLALRIDLSDNPSFEQLLGRVRQVALGAYGHQDLPFEKLIEELQPQRSLSHNPLFQVMFVLQNAPMRALELGNLQLEPLESETTIAKFDLTLTLEEAATGLVGSWEYNSDLFERETIDRLNSHFQVLIEGIIDRPAQQIQALPLLSAAERQQLLVEWNDTAVAYPDDKCIHHLFEEQVEKTPDAVAVVFEDEQLTYQQLNQRANQLAHHLQGLGVKPEVLVGICVERSLAMVVGLLGILKAGGAYVPLDPSYPPERLSYMLADAGVEVLLTQQDSLASLPAHSARLVCVDTDWDSIAQASDTNLCSGVVATNLAYVIYTSGSTGLPKGVQIEHRSLGNLTLAQRQLFALTPSSRILQFASLGFDASVWEIFMAVTTGARLILGTAAALMPGEDLAQMLQHSAATHVTLPPSVLAVLPTDKLLPALGQMIVAGEAGSLAVVAPWSVGRRLFNAYGPTEATVCATVAQIVAGSERLPIGTPIANTQIYILDRDLQPVPIGVSGELHIGGDSLARGYLNRPDLTAAKFIPHPFSDDESARLYKTGDLGRYLPDGNIEFLGRIDNQVKIRGFRIELGEVEAVLSAHPQVQQAVVIDMEDRAGNQRLVAYLVRATADESLNSSQVREYVKHRLPAYMVPAAIVTLDSIPLTPNGKVDRKALPIPDGEISRMHEYVAPRTPSEEIIANIFASVLSVRTVGIYDNFFDLGGHSLLAIQLVSRIQQHFQINLPLAILFESPTVEQLAIVIDSPLSTKLWSSLVSIQSDGSLPPFFCIPGVGGNVLCFAKLAEYLGKNQPFYGLQAQGLDGEQSPLESIEEIAHEYIKDIKRVQSVGPYFLGGHSFGGKVAFEMAQQLRKEGESVAFVAVLDISPMAQSDRHSDLQSWDRAMWICQITEVIGGISGENLSISYDAIASLPQEAQLQYLKQQLEMIEFLPPETDIKLVKGLLEVFKTQSQINYIPHNSYPVPITLFRAQNQTSPENSSDLSQDYAWGWNQFADGEVVVHTVPGNHISMMNEPHVKILAQKLQKSLELARNIVRS